MHQFKENNNCSFILVESNTSLHGTGIRFIEKIKSLGYKAVLLTSRPELYHRLSSSVEIKVTNTTSILEMISVCSNIMNIVGIWSTASYYIPFAAELATKLGLYSPDPQSLRIANNKFYQREILSDALIPQPKYVHLKTLGDALQAYRNVFNDQPVVLKPIAGDGKSGVRLVSNLKDLEDHARILAGRTSNQRGDPIIPGFLMEEYIYENGNEFSVELFDAHPICVIQRISKPPFFMEEGNYCPANIEATTTSTLMHLASKAAIALGLNWGPVHIEFKVNASGDCSLIEVNPRMAGAFIPIIVEQALGVDMIKNTLLKAAGKSVHVSQEKSRHSIVLFKILEAEGVVSSIQNIADNSYCDGLIEATMYPKRGDRLSRRYDSSDRIGHVITVADEYGCAVEMASKFSSKLGVMFN